FFLCHATPPTALSPLSLHDALPISTSPARATWAAPVSAARTGPASATSVPTVRARTRSAPTRRPDCPVPAAASSPGRVQGLAARSGEHTSELQSLTNLGCRLLP